MTTLRREMVGALVMLLVILYQCDQGHRGVAYALALLLGACLLNVATWDRLWADRS